MTTRQSFEQWITAPPFERSINRHGPDKAWPGHYCEYEVQLAWEAYERGAASNSTCIRLYMSDIDKSALEKHDGKTGIVLYVTPADGLPHGATHAVYQGMAILGTDHRVIGHARMYEARRDG
jgi:hypothetical protein